MTDALLVLGMTLATMATRIPVLMWLTRGELPPGVARALRYVPPAVLSAIIFPYVLLPGNHLDLSLGNAPLLASVFATLVAWRTRNLLLTIVLGMAFLLIARALLS